MKAASFFINIRLNLTESARTDTRFVLFPGRLRRFLFIYSVYPSVRLYGISPIGDSISSRSKISSYLSWVLFG
jgi:hypothetical protein